MSESMQELTLAADLFPPKIELWRYTPDRLALGDFEFARAPSVQVAKLRAGIAWSTRAGAALLLKVGEFLPTLKNVNVASSFV